jgi:hypothetical protein
MSGSLVAPIFQVGVEKRASGFNRRLTLMSFMVRIITLSTGVA